MAVIRKTQAGFSLEVFSPWKAIFIFGLREESALVLSQWHLLINLWSKTGPTLAKPCWSTLMATENAIPSYTTSNINTLTFHGQVREILPFQCFYWHHLWRVSEPTPPPVEEESEMVEQHNKMTGILNKNIQIHRPALWRWQSWPLNWSCHFLCFSANNHKIYGCNWALLPWSLSQILLLE